MINEKRERIAEMLIHLSEIFDKETSESLIKIYISCLEIYPWDKIEAATMHIIRTKTFNKFPLPAEFIQYIDPPEDMDVRVHCAMVKVFDMMERFGAYSSVEFDDPIIHHVLVHLHGGWVEACNSRRSRRTETDDRFWRRDFETTYARIARSGSHAEPPPLIGLLNKQNEESGYFAPGLLKPSEPSRLPNHQPTLPTAEERPSIAEHSESDKQDSLDTETKD
ncbi:MAG: DUF6475 domain-containing protein [Candidatus Zixiibacteriota bacterium]